MTKLAPSSLNERSFFTPPSTTVKKKCPTAGERTMRPKRHCRAIPQTTGRQETAFRFVDMTQARKTMAKMPTKEIIR
jgi:hypothetical protein